MNEVINYASEVIPFLRLGREYQEGVAEGLRRRKWDFYAVANFNRIAQPDWCAQQLNRLDMRLCFQLLGRNWSRKPKELRPFWIAIPEQATCLHYNILWQVPFALRSRFILISCKIQLLSRRHQERMHQLLKFVKIGLGTSRGPVAERQRSADHLLVELTLMSCARSPLLPVFSSKKRRQPGLR